MLNCGRLLERLATDIFPSFYRGQRYFSMPVLFRPKSVGKFEALLVIQTDEGKSVAIRLIGEALEKN